MAILLVLIVIVAVVLVMIIFTARAMKQRNTVGPNAIPGQPGCGGCGYPTRGLSELICPECGADLRKVGIAKPGDGGAGLAGCVLPLLLTVMVFLLAVAGYNLAEQFVPTHWQYSISFDLSPESDEYSSVLIDVNMTIVTPAGNRSSISGVDINSTYSGSMPVTDIKFGGTGSTVKARDIKMQVMPKGISGGTVTYGPRLIVDPQTRLATWTDAQGKTRISQGPVSDMDVLAFLGANGASTGNTLVVGEAQQLHAVLDGLIVGTNQFTLQGFDSGGYGAGGSSQLGPVWFLPTYFGAWFVIWIATMIFLARRAKKRITAN